MLLDFFGFSIKFTSRGFIFLINKRHGSQILKETASRQNHISYRKVYFNEFVANALRDNIGSKKISLQTQKKKIRFLKKKISNWDFHLEISHLRKKVFILTSKMWIRTLYVKRFRSSDLFVFSTLPQRMNSAKQKILVSHMKAKLNFMGIEQKKLNWNLVNI